MKRFLCVFFCLFLLCSFVIPAFAGNTVILNYEPWLFYYDLEDCDENYNIWLGMYSYGGSEELYPIHIDEDLYFEKLLESENSDGDDNDTTTDDNSSGDDISTVDLDSLPVRTDLETSAVSSWQESSDTESIATMAVTVPTSGQSYILPEVVNIEYAPDADDGSLLGVLYGLLGKPVVSYTYKVRTSNSSSAYDGYLVQQLEYDANWIASLALLLVVLFCIFKAGGALLCKM